ncbi:S-methyl-5-thioribose-1-phosphate isomerase MRI1 Ecym_4427 [Eremothecium cymbalariae DBVPG|uniref:Methylthioribose-1-phosphate isomerase n=1 Tax=Eremothecium cymbalariae (strain CBS 270.75 / DBVPG 7215 / KCTC 17166 / NRRL Y-17582) TaxID=931890 RepID=G8JTX2_ERECY|nr:hypothetical protein Ecym_4427 [Eremothecium cymbalariae DBVPG\
MSLEAIKFDRADKNVVSVKVLDQLLLPYITKYVAIYTIDDGFAVIKSMQVRGAPAIAIVGVLSVLMECQLLKNEAFVRSQCFYDMSSFSGFTKTLMCRLEFLLSSRPTAVNLSNSIMDMRRIVDDPNCGSFVEFFDRLYDYACKLIDDDLRNNKIMGDHGARYLLESLAQEEGFEQDFAVLTICNTGSLATSGYGTALGVIRSLWQDSQYKVSSGGKEAKKQKTSANSGAKLVHVYPLETRPYNQGSRLTAYELKHDGIPSTLITDSSIAYRISTCEVPIKAAFVGADRIVRNGDTANKIGTFQLALVCKHFGIKFFVVAPKSTVDNVTETGADIFIEERNPDEFRIVTGTALDPTSAAPTPVLNSSGEPTIGKVGITPPDMDVWNPSFDVTPHKYIDGIITEQGVFTKDKNGNFDLTELF